MNDIKLEWHESTEQRLFEAWKNKANSEVFFRIAYDVMCPIVVGDFYYMWNFYTDWNEPTSYNDIRQTFLRVIMNLLRDAIEKSKLPS